MMAVLAGATSAAHSSVSLGDLPTWIAAVGGLAAAYVVLRQLAVQRADSIRQTRQLERQQANGVDVTWCGGRQGPVP